MQRRNFIKSIIIGSLAVNFSSCAGKEKTHLISLSFDDGYKKSFYKIADIYEDLGLRACLNVIASGHLPDFLPPDEYQNVTRGNFDDWNKLKERGHEIMPHSWDHSNLTQMPLEKAKEDIDKCLLYFSKHLQGFNALEAVYNFAFNASTPDLEEYALSKVMAVRTQGDSAINPIPTAYKQARRLGCWSYGPDNADIWVEQQVSEFLKSTGGWLILNLHGLDDESWGPISSTYLNDLLKRLVKLEYLDILPVGEVYKKYSN
jgi:peptidoglycan/xylan/chitin deacetylase (PgdA/CDA1 family)